MKSNLVSLCLSGKVFIKTLVLILLFSACYLSSLAQFSYGIKAGLNLTSFEYSYGSAGREKQIRQGFHMGIATKVKLFQKAYLTPEFLYVQRGNFDFGLINKTDFNYIEIPFLFSYELLRVLELQGGVNFASRITPDLNKSFLGLSLGTTCNITENIFLSARFNHDFSPIIDGVFGWSLFANAGYRIKS
jgi:hypothetical protein